MLSGIVTLLLLLLFVAIWAWAWRPQHQQNFDRAARLALDEDDAGHQGASAGNGKPQP
ncbi:cbb3-type cytochrome oxidase subunit 3 [Lysobacter koreensis]|uniref:Cbb3-type cytochrome oxidase subunit 3 n=1 Tax=Lysobacter koreensis TaxID=266122 RepID=A0ABW2YK56_9GAMM